MFFRLCVHYNVKITRFLPAGAYLPVESVAGTMLPCHPRPSGGMGNVFMNGYIRNGFFPTKNQRPFELALLARAEYGFGNILMLTG